MTEFLILILILIAVAVLVRVDFIIYIAYVLLGVYALSRWLVPRSLSKLAAVRRFYNRAFLSEPVEIEVRLTNRSRLPIMWLQLVESVPTELRAGPSINHVIHLGPRATRRITYSVRALKRGFYRLGPLNMTAGDLFGFQERHASIEPDYLTVYPRIIPLSQLSLPSRLPFGTVASKQRLFEDPARPQGVRDYRLGDSLRLVNWKVSAHSDTLLVRTHQPAISLETAILLNLNADEYSPRFRRDGPEWAIVVAASLASHLVTQRQAVGLISNGADPLLQHSAASGEAALYDESSGRLSLAQSAKAKDNQNPDEPPDDLVSDPIPPKPGREHLMQILERLARLEGASTREFAPFAFRATKRLNWGVTLMIISPGADEALCNTLHRLVRAGFNVVLLTVEHYIDFASIQKWARLLGFHAYHVPDRAALRRWQQEGTHAS